MMEKRDGIIRALYSDEQGGTSIEYGLLSLVVSISAVVAITAYGDSFNDMLTHIATAIANALAH